MDAEVARIFRIFSILFFQLIQYKSATSDHHFPLPEAPCKGLQKLLLNFRLIYMWRGTRLSPSQDVVRGRSCADIGCEVGNAFVLEFAVALNNHTAVFAVGVPDL